MMISLHELLPVVGEEVLIENISTKYDT